MTQKLQDLNQAFVPVPLIDESFGSASQTAKLEVLRTWPKSSSVAFARYELIDVNRAEANQPIELWCHSLWSTMSIEKYDVLIISGCRVEKFDYAANGHANGGNMTVNGASTMYDPLECFYKMVVDDNTENATIIVYSWRDRILSRPGKLFTLASLKDDELKCAENIEYNGNNNGQSDHMQDDDDIADDDDVITVSAMIAERSTTSSKKRKHMTSSQSRKKSAKTSAASAPKTGMRSADHYIYAPLNELRADMRDVNVYGIVRSVGAPKQTKGTDHMMIISVTDMTLPDDGTTINVSIFRKQLAQLPEDLAVGDIIRMHRIEMDTYKAALVGVLKNLRGQYICLRGAPSTDMSPYFVTSEQYSQIDEEIVTALRQYSTTMQSTITSLGSRVYGRRICDLSASEYVDLTVRVLHVDQAHSMMYVWDGTDLPSTVSWTHSTLANDQTFAPNQKAPELGSIAPVNFSNNTNISTIRIGSWHRLRNVRIERNRNSVGATVFSIRYHTTSSVDIAQAAFVTDLTSEYMTRLKAHNAATAVISANAIHPSPMTKVLRSPMTMLPFVAWTPIKVITSIAESYDHEYRIRARIAAVRPIDVTKWIKVRCRRCAQLSDCAIGGADACSACQSADIVYEYAFCLVCVDASGVLAACIYGSRAQNVFPSLSPVNLNTNTLTRDTINKYAEMMTATGQWIDCIIKPYELVLPPTRRAADNVTETSSSSEEFPSQLNSQLSIAEDAPSQLLMERDPLIATSMHRSPYANKNPNRRYRIVDTVFMPL